jgi:hypothetical protein
LSPLLSEMRKEINGAPISAELKAATRKTLGKRLKKTGGDDYVGKAGFGVGKASKAKKAKAAKRAGDKSRRGVGVSANNIHWFVLGTAERKTKKGHATGAIEAMLAGFVAKASQSSSSRITEAARKKITQVLAAEAAKKKG